MEDWRRDLLQTLEAWRLMPDDSGFIGHLCDAALDWLTANPDALIDDFRLWLDDVRDCTVVVTMSMDYDAAGGFARGIENLKGTEGLQ